MTAATGRRVAATAVRAGERFARRLRAHFAWVLLAVGAVLMPLVPPLQSPDEGDHIKRVYALADGQILPRVPAGGQTGFDVDRGLVRFVEANCYFARFECTPTMDAARRDQLDAIAWSGDETFSTAPGTGYYFPAIYLPQAIGLGLGRLAGLSVLDSYRLARWGSLLAACVLLAVAFRLQPPNVLVMTLLLLPMVLFQSLAASQDGVATALAVLAAAAFVRGMDRTRPFDGGLAALLASSVFLLAAGRIYLLPMALLPVLVGVARRSRRDLVAGLVVAGAALAWFAFASATTVDTRMPRALGTGAMAAHYLSHPGELAGVLWNTLTDPVYLRSYREQFIGVLGWLDARLPQGAYGVLTGVLVLAAVLSIPRRGGAPARRERAALAIAAFGSAALVFLALLFGWTPFPATVVLGVQGRYFIVPALLIAAALSVREDPLRGPRAALSALLLLGLLLGVPAMTAQALAMRYWLPSGAPAVAADAFEAVPAAPAGVTREMRPSPGLAADRPIPLRGIADDGRRLVAIDVAFGTYQRVNPGRAVLRLDPVDGSAPWREGFGLAGLADNQYLRFTVPPGAYAGGAIEPVEGGGVSVWESHASDGDVASCVVLHFAGAKSRTTPGCDLPRLPPPAQGGTR